VLLACYLAASIAATNDKPHADRNGHCHRTEASRAAGDEDGVAGFGAHEPERLQRGEGGERHAGGLLVREVVGHVRERALSDRRVLGERADLGERHAPVHAVADCEAARIRKDP